MPRFATCRLVCSRPPGRSLLLGILLMSSLISACGDDQPSKTTVYKQEASKTLKSEGTAESPEEAARRVAEEETRLLRAKAQDELKKKILPALRKAEDPDSIIDALGAFGRLGEAALEEIARLEPFRTHDEPDVRAAALDSYCQINKAGALEAVTKALSDKHVVVVEKALRLWRELKVDSIKPILAFVESEDPKIQVAALNFLTERKNDPDVQLAIEKNLASFAAPAAKVAIKYLSTPESAVPGSVALIRGMLDHKDGTTRVEAVRALGRLNAKTYPVVRKLVQTLGDDPDDLVVRETHTLLKAWAGSNAPNFDPAAEGEVRSTQMAAWKTWLELNRSSFPD